MTTPFRVSLITICLLFLIISPLTFDFYNSSNIDAVMDNVFTKGTEISKEMTVSFGRYEWKIDWPYPPITILFILPSWYFYNYISDNIFLYQYLFKLPIFLSVVICGYILEKNTRTNKFSSAYLLNPGIIFLTIFWGGFDIINGLLLFLTYHFYIQRKYSKGLFMLSLASALRIYPIVLLPLFLIPYIRLRKFKEIIKYSLITISAPFTFFILGNFLGNGSLTELILFYQSSYGPFGIYPILLSIVIIINKFRVSSIDRSVIPFILLSLLFLSQTAIFLLNYKGVINLKKSILISLLLIFLFYPKMHSLYILAVLPISILLENWRVTKSLWIPGTIWALFVNGIEDNRGLPYWFYWLTHYKFSLPEMYNHGITILMSTLYLSLIVICILNILKPSEKPQNNTNTLVN